MPRALRLSDKDSYYHVLNRGVSHNPIVFCDTDYNIFIKGLKEVSEKFQIDIFAFCLMTNHFHLAIRTEHANLSEGIKYLGQTFTQRINKIHGRDGPLFKGRFKSICVTDEAYLFSLIRYIHLNPVEAGLTADPSAYRWSSHPFYKNGNHPSWLKCEKILSSFAINQSAARYEFEKFIAEGNEKTLASFYRRKNLAPHLNGDTACRSFETQVNQLKRADLAPF
ncbi:MAG: transposase [Deltaproteobacteria bacterium]|nr:transposase [Deltaproteobacteria bacterium]